MSHLPLSPVVITGLGLSTAFGDRESTWSAILSGRSAARWLSLNPPFAACVHPTQTLSPLDHLHLAAHEALQHAGLVPDLRVAGAESSTPQRTSPAIRQDLDPTRVATVVGFSKGDVRTLSLNHQQGFPTPSNWPLTWPSGAASALSSRFNFQGPSLGPVAACASGVVAVLQAARLIQTGVCDVVLAGAGDSPVEPLVIAALRQMRVLARIEPGSDPARAAPL